MSTYLHCICLVTRDPLHFTHFINHLPRHNGMRKCSMMPLLTEMPLAYYSTVVHRIHQWLGQKGTFLVACCVRHVKGDALQSTELLVTTELGLRLRFSMSKQIFARIHIVHEATTSLSSSRASRSDLKYDRQVQ